MKIPINYNNNKTDRYGSNLSKSTTQDICDLMVGTMATNNQNSMSNQQNGSTNESIGNCNKSTEATTGGSNESDTSNSSEENNFKNKSSPDSTERSTKTHKNKFVMLENSSKSDKNAPKNKLSRKATDTLKAWFLNHLDHPYPSSEDKSILCQLTGLSKTQILNWFTNSRKVKSFK